MRFMESFAPPMASPTQSPNVLAQTPQISSSPSTAPDLSTLSIQSRSRSDSQGPSSPLGSSSTSTGADYVHITSASLDPNDQSPRTLAQSLFAGSSDAKARLLYCKSHVAIHPTNFSRDNIVGYLGIVEVDYPPAAWIDAQGNVASAAGPAVQDKDEGSSRMGGKAGQGKMKELLVTWVPMELLDRMDEEDREGYRRVESRSGAEGRDVEEDGFVFVSIPPPKGEKYAFSVPVSQIYSILVYAPSLSHWYGSATFNLSGGFSLPTLYFHDDESPLLSSSAQLSAAPPHPTPSPRSQWGFPPFLALLGSRATMLRSRLITPRQNSGAELWLVNPSRADREVHEAGYEEERPRPIKPTARVGAPVPPASSPSTSPTSARKPSLPGDGPQGTPPPRRASAAVTAGLFGASFIPNYPPEAQFPSSPLSSNPTTPKQSIMLGLSNITNLGRKAAKEMLNHKLAQPVVPHLPPAMRSLVNAQGEWEGIGRRGSAPSLGRTGQGINVTPGPFGPGSGGRAARGKGSEVATEFESARLYLARWARVVAEEGERARKAELARSAGRFGSIATGSPGGVDILPGSLGVFSLLHHPSNANSKRPVPSPTRTPDDPITSRDWDSFAAQGRDEEFVRQQIFRRGFSSSEDTSEKRARREGWEVLLGLVRWDVGGVGGGEAGKVERKDAREKARERKRREYEELRDKWRSKVGHNPALSLSSALESGAGGAGEVDEGWREEWHRIDVDCRRTDRNLKIFAVPDHIKRSGDEEKEGGGAGSSRIGEVAGTASAPATLSAKGKGKASDGSMGAGGSEGAEGSRSGAKTDGWDGKGENEEGGMAALNPHIAALRTILMTYHTYSPDLGYVQGMSDLLSPIYVVFDANEADAFWGLVGVMEMMESNFLRDQSGMKRQLSTLQKLISVMDPELYSHLERTDSLNLFFCFRWILINFKREFAFNQVIRLWEVLWTNHYSDQFNLFVALAILQSHRDVLMRYLVEFDEVLKYANDLSGSIDLDTTLAQAEVLFLTFRGLVDDLDKDIAIAASTTAPSPGTSPTSGTALHAEQIALGLRKRRGSGISIKSEKGEVVKGGEVAELRGLVKGWGQDVRDEEDLEVVLRSRSASRKGSTAEGGSGEGEGRRKSVVDEQLFFPTGL